MASVDFGPGLPETFLSGLSLPFDPPEELVYVFGWNDLAAARLELTTRREGGDLLVEYTVRSLPIVQSLWTMEASGRTRIDSTGLRPLDSVFESRSGDRTTSYATSFDWSAGRATVVKRKVRKGRTREKTRAIGVGLDAACAFLALRAAGPGRSVRVVQGEDAYQVTVVDEGRRPMETSAGTVEALQLAVGVRKLEEAAGAADFSSARVWLHPETRVPLRLEAQAAIGSFYAQWAEAPATE